MLIRINNKKLSGWNGEECNVSGKAGTEKSRTRSETEKSYLKKVYEVRQVFGAWAIGGNANQVYYCDYFFSFGFPETCWRTPGNDLRGRRTRRNSCPGYLALDKYLNCLRVEVRLVRVTRRSSSFAPVRIGICEEWPCAGKTIGMRCVIRVTLKWIALLSAAVRNGPRTCDLPGQPLGIRINIIM